MVVASGRSNRHVGAIADQLVAEAEGAGLPRSCGSRACRSATGCWSMRAMWWCISSGPRCEASTISRSCGRLTRPTTGWQCNALRVSLIAVGRMKPGPEKTIAGDYLARAEALGRKCGVGASQRHRIRGIPGLLARFAHGRGRKARCGGPAGQELQRGAGRARQGAGQRGLRRTAAPAHRRGHSRHGLPHRRARTAMRPASVITRGFS